jgi:hypothetical protein
MKEIRLSKSALKRNLLSYIFVIFTIFEGGDVKFYIKDNMFIILMLVFSLTMLLFSRNKSVGNNATLIKYALFMIAFYVLNYILTDLSSIYIATYIGMIFRVIIALSITSILEADEFIDKFISIISFLCFTSLIFFVIGYVDPNIRHVFPIIKKINGSEFGNAFLYSYNLSQNALSMVRNSGVFNEPGRYQIFISLAMLFELSKNKFKNKKRIMLFIITMITTGSTTGYLCLVIVLLATAFNKKEVKIRYKILTITGSMLLVFSSKFSNNITNKFSTDNLSYTRRNLDILIDSELFAKAPIIGNGIRNYMAEFNQVLRMETGLNYNNTVQSSSNAFTAQFAMYGVLVTIPILVGIYRFINKYTFNRGMSLFLTIILMLTLCMSQNILNTILFMSLSFYGYKKKNFNV